MLKIYFCIGLLFLLAISLGQEIALSDFLKAEGIEETQVLDNYSSQFSRIINNLEKELGGRKSIHQQHTIMYKYLHETLFKKYSFIPFLTIIFDINYYNYLTATILYALMTESLGHSYQLYMSPKYVFLIVSDPAGKEIYIDLSDRENGFDSKENKKAMLNILLSHKLITEEEARNSNPDMLVKDYFENSNPISIEDLLPLYYTYIAASHSSAKRYGEAYNNIEAAMRLNPTIPKVNKNFLSLWTTYRNMLFQDENYNILDSLLISSSPLLHTNDDFRFVFGEFLKTYTVYLVNKKNKLNNALELLSKISTFLNKELVAEIEQLLYVQKTEELLSRGEYFSAYNTIKNIYIAFPEAVQVGELFITTCQNYMGELVNSGNYKEATRQLDSLLILKPENTLIKQLYSNVLLAEMSLNSARYIADPLAAESLLVAAHTMDTTNVSIKQSLVYLYHTRGMQFTRENDLENARIEIEKGLLIDPENGDLLEDLRLLNEQLSP